MDKKQDLNLLVSYSLAGVLYGDNRSYLDLFVPFIATLSEAKNIQIFERDKYEEYIKLFFEEFGIEIPFYAFKLILEKKCIKAKLVELEKQGTQYRVNIEKREKFSFEKERKTEQRGINGIIKAFENFCVEEKVTDLDSIQKKELFFSAIKKNISLILGDINNIEEQWRVTHKFKKYRALTSKFFVNIEKNDNELYKKMIDISVGYVISSNVIIENFEEKNFLKNCEVFIDTPIMLSLVGVDGEEFQNIYINFFEQLKKSKASFRIFQHNLDEIHFLFDIAKDKIGQPYNLKSNRMVKSLQKRKITKFDILKMQSNIRHKLDEYGFKIIKCEEFKTEDSQIMKEFLRSAFMKSHNIKDDAQDRSIHEGRIKKDVDSLLSLYQMRGKEKYPCSIMEQSKLFITNNTSFFKIENNFKESFQIDKRVCNVSYTDMFLSTLLWLREPKGGTRKAIADTLIANCHLSLEHLDTELKDRFIVEVKSKRDNNEITPEKFETLCNDTLVEDLIKMENFNSVESITNIQVEEIIRNYDKQIKKEYSEIIEIKDQKIKALEDKLEEKNRESINLVTKTAEKKFALKKILSWWIPIIILLIFGVYFRSIVMLIFSFIFFFVDIIHFVLFLQKRDKIKKESYVTKCIEKSQRKSIS